MCAVIHRVYNDQKQYLLVRVKKDFGKYTSFLQPVGGHVEDNENEKAALAREIFEELGVKSKVGKKITTTSLDVPNELAHWYKCKLVNIDFQVNYSEIASVEWLTLDEIRNETKIWPATKRFLLEL